MSEEVAIALLHETKALREIIETMQKRISFQNLRIARLEEWKEDFDSGTYSMV